MSGIDDTDRSLLGAIEDGFSIVSRPYAEIARQIGITEDDVIERLGRLLEGGVIKRLGLVVRHRAVGFQANAMVVWDVPDAEVDQAADDLTAHPFVTLCYRRPRRPPEWPYNLFCMVHGRDRGTVKTQIAQLNASAGLGEMPSSVLFSKRCFKQRGARFSSSNVEPVA